MGQAGTGTTPVITPNSRQDVNDLFGTIFGSRSRAPFAGVVDRQDSRTPSPLKFAACRAGSGRIALRRMKVLTSLVVIVFALSTGACTSAPKKKESCCADGSCDAPATVHGKKKH